MNIGLVRPSTHSTMANGSVLKVHCTDSVVLTEAVERAMHELSSVTVRREDNHEHMVKFQIDAANRRRPRWPGAREKRGVRSTPAVGYFPATGSADKVPEV
jgi:hypothetical protein